MSEGSEIVITLPPLPLTEVLLFALSLLLYKMHLLLREGVTLLKSIAEHEKERESMQLRSRCATEAMSKASSSTAIPVSPPPAPSPPVVERFLNISAQRFGDCLLDQTDIDTAKFLRACRHFGTVLEKAGPFTLLSIRETQANISKIEHTCVARRVWACSPSVVVLLP